jgi:hypothetical protein
VRDSRVEELLALLREAVRAVEIERMRLRRECDLAVAASRRSLDQPFEERAADASPAPPRKHGHAADVRHGPLAASLRRKQPRRADCTARLVARQCVHAQRVMRVELQLFGNALLEHEHRPANGARLLMRRIPIRQLDPQHRRKV